MQVSHYCKFLLFVGCIALASCGSGSSMPPPPVPGNVNTDSSNSNENDSIEDNNSDEGKDSEESDSGEDNNSGEGNDSEENDPGEDNDSGEGNDSEESDSGEDNDSGEGNDSEESDSGEDNDSGEGNDSGEPATSAIYLKNTLGYSQPHVHYWDMDLDTEVEGPWDTVWPGQAMTLVKEQLYTYTLPDDVPVGANIGIVFNGDDSKQTSDLVFSADNNCYSSGEWISLEACQDDAAALPSGQRSVYVHLFEWSWNDIAEECEQWLGPKGYAAVQVSPPQEHIQGDEWWTRYQPVSFSIDQSRSGTRAEFINMVERCASVGVDIYVDAVINHMAAGDSSGIGSAGTPYNPNTLDYPDLSAQDFHDDCTVENSDYGNNAHRVRTCRLVGLPDLETGSKHVRNLLAGYMNDMIAIGVNGFRIDAAKHMSVADIEAIIHKLDDDVYIFQEVIDLGGEAVSASEYIGISDVTEFKYSAEIGRVFRSGELEWLENFNEMWGIEGSGERFMDSEHAVVFTDNHDNQRGHGAGGANILTYKDDVLYKLSNIFMLAWPYGYPKVMSSYAFTDTEVGPPGASVHGESLNCFGDEWVCEHRWRSIANMVEFRNQSASHPMTHWWADGNQLAFGRGDHGFVIINRSDSPLTQTLATGMEPGEYCNVIEADFNPDTNSCSATVIVDGAGQISVNLGSMNAIAIHAGARL